MYSLENDIPVVATSDRIPAFDAVLCPKPSRTKAWRRAASPRGFMEMTADILPHRIGIRSNAVSKKSSDPKKAVPLLQPPCLTKSL